MSCAVPMSQSRSRSRGVDRGVLPASAPPEAADTRWHQRAPGRTLKLWLHGWQPAGPRGVETGWVTEPTGADSGPAGRGGGAVANEVIGTCSVAGHSSNARQMVKSQKVADSPRNVVVGARCISAHTDATDNFLAGCIKTKASPENVNAADLASDPRV